MDIPSPSMSPLLNDYSFFKKNMHVDRSIHGTRKLRYVKTSESLNLIWAETTSSELHVPSEGRRKKTTNTTKSHYKVKENTCW